jgi:tetratricopeptide (TPR) repeat protein
LIWWKTGKLHRKDLLPTVPFVGLGIVFAVLTVVIEREVSGADGADWSFSFSTRVIIAGQALWFYLGKIFLPLNLTYLYPRWAVDSATLLDSLYPIGILVTLIGAIFLKRKTGRSIPAALLIFIGTLFPVLGFFDFYLMRYTFVADHFQYISCISIIVITSGIITRFVLGRANTNNRMIFCQTVAARGLVACLLLALGGLTWRQSHIYQDAEALWSDTLKKDPSSWVSHNNLGKVFFDRGEYKQATYHFENAIRLKPNLAEAEFNLAVILLKTKDYDGAIAHGMRAIHLQSGVSQFYSVLGSALWKKGDISQAERYFLNAIQSHSPGPQLYYNLGVLYLQNTNQFGENYQQQAISYLEKALELEPTSLQTMYTLAWTLATHPNSHIRNGARALQIAEMACQVTAYKDYRLLDTLAAAYAAMERFPEAVKTAQKAVDLSRTEAPKDRAKPIMERMQLYQSQLPYYQSALEPARTS